MSPEIERIPLAVSSDFKMQPVRADIPAPAKDPWETIGPPVPVQPAVPRVSVEPKIVGFEPANPVEPSAQSATSIPTAPQTQSSHPSPSADVKGASPTPVRFLVLSGLGIAIGALWELSRRKRTINEPTKAGEDAIKTAPSPLSNKNEYSEYEESIRLLKEDLPGIADTIEKHAALVGLRFGTIERNIASHHQGRDKIIKAGIIAGGASLLFPPFYFQGTTGSRIGLGHSFILSPPKINPDNPSIQTVGVIDGIGLIAITIGISLITWAATLVKWRN